LKLQLAKFGTFLLILDVNSSVLGLAFSLLFKLHFINTPCCQL